MGTIEYRNADGSLKYIETVKSHERALNFGSYLVGYDKYEVVAKEWIGDGRTGGMRYTYRNDDAPVNGATIIVCG